MMVYRAKVLHGFRKPGAGPRRDLIYTAALIPPEWIPWFHEIAVYMNKTGLLPKDWTTDMATEYMMKEQLWYHKNTDVSWAYAATKAKNSALEYKAVRARSFGGVVGGLLLVGIAVVVGLALTSWFDGCSGWMPFGADAFFFRYRERFWFAGLVGHTYADSWEFYRGREATGLIVHDYRAPYRWKGRLDTWAFDKTWQVFRNTFVPWHVFTIETMDLIFVGKGENMGWGYYRVWVPDGMADWKVKPVGWGRREFDALEWSTDFLKDFKCR
ncbi:hypothetical protein ES707_10869 [subsurface metagenome]